MFTVLADAMFHATRTERHVPERGTKDWADRFVPKNRRKGEMVEYRFNPYRDLW